jgi:catechol 2,3-dioxygenase-like lactoylglutathione lyase family enzyme
MASGAGLLGAVVVVRDLARSEAFYRDVLDLHVDDSSVDAVLLSARAGDHLVLRALSDAPHVLGGIGPLFLVWMVESAHDLDRAEEALRSRDALVSRSVEHGWEVVEGRDPDEVRIVVVFPVSRDAAKAVLPPRVYTY